MPFLLLRTRLAAACTCKETSCACAELPCLFFGGLSLSYAVFCYCKRVWRRRGCRNVNGSKGRDRVLAGGVVTQRKTLHTCAFARSGIVPWPPFS